MAEAIEIEIVTPERLVIKDVAQEIQIPAKNGYIGVLPGHAPLITELSVGEIVYRSGGAVHRLACASGFAEVLPNKVTILTETAERAAEIDTQRAHVARTRAEERLQTAQTEADYERALNALRRAEVRLQVAAGL
ncbi:MAG TPA: F0F1 ATP synthase subunit epsilon [Terriglobales bacterium]|nr:F0F1 ATP synthase subunit epsilon [Terriglobales bacterium]